MKNNLTHFLASVFTVLIIGGIVGSTNDENIRMLILVAFLLPAYYWVYKCFSEHRTE